MQESIINSNTTSYHGHGFQLSLLEGWQDETTHLLAGPVSDRLRHNVTIQVYEAEEDTTLLKHTAIQIEWLKALLPDFRLLYEDKIKLNVGIVAARVIYTWVDEEKRRLFQEQLYVLFENNVYHLTATFSRKTRKRYGKATEEIMLDFIPGSHR